ncbi:hypothetical protein AURDEDRAFT_122769 [Auricularia subglabra TFB-10046 SS5]|nr:hypothetical protein AURDEDRAFT_122769 [Auricularia subglabra TFB-10046 SS5]
MYDHQARLGLAMCALAHQCLLIVDNDDHIINNRLRLEKYLVIIRDCDLNHTISEPPSQEGSKVKYTRSTLVLAQFAKSIDNLSQRVGRERRPQNGFPDSELEAENFRNLVDIASSYAGIGNAVSSAEGSGAPNVTHAPADQTSERTSHLFPILGDYGRFTGEGNGASYIEDMSHRRSESVEHGSWTRIWRTWIRDAARILSLGCLPRNSDVSMPFPDPLWEAWFSTEGPPTWNEWAQGAGEAQPVASPGQTHGVASVESHTEDAPAVATMFAGALEDLERMSVGEDAPAISERPGTAASSAQEATGVLRETAEKVSKLRVPGGGSNDDTEKGPTGDEAMLALREHATPRIDSVPRLHAEEGALTTPPGAGDSSASDKGRTSSDRVAPGAPSASHFPPVSAGDEYPSPPEHRGGAMASGDDITDEPSRTRSRSDSTSDSESEPVAGAPVGEGLAEEVSGRAFTPVPADAERGGGGEGMLSLAHRPQNTGVGEGSSGASPARAYPAAVGGDVVIEMGVMGARGTDVQLGKDTAG